MAEEKTFEVQLEMHIQETTDGEAKPFFDAPVAYHNLPYDGVVALQKMMVGLLDDLTKLGEAKVEEKGLKPKFDKLLKARGNK